MAGSSTFPKFTIVLGILVFLLGLSAFVIILSRGGGMDLMSIIAMVIGLAGVVIGRRILRRMGAGSGGL
ncbi:MAG: hypothetical protein Q8W51_07540 [Candidatus Palauibacterales bacterium]|nr:hypothetical protein [Candidatus Palauibacterales bacterium]MDP2529574.1 hypothetical protein [Candidatus Palauibacterales bacterium]MDP2582637.1 hypothetical protein [Candidatus Palauibacterales bacterium]